MFWPTDNKLDVSDIDFDSRIALVPKSVDTTTTPTNPTTTTPTTTTPTTTTPTTTTTTPTTTTTTPTTTTTTPTTTTPISTSLSASEKVWFADFYPPSPVHDQSSTDSTTAQTTSDASSDQSSTHSPGQSDTQTPVHSSTAHTKFTYQDDYFPSLAFSMYCRKDPLPVEEMKSFLDRCERFVADLKKYPGYHLTFPGILFTHREMKCVALRSSTDKAWRGYVQIPENNLADLSEDFVHGGFTGSANFHGVEMLGFDCCHYDDFYPTNTGGKNVWTFELVQAELKSAVDSMLDGLKYNWD